MTDTTPTTITAEANAPYLEVVREFNAPPALVFRAYTDPELIVQWLGPRELHMEVLEFDGRDGGGYRYVHRDAEGKEYTFRGVFHSVVAPTQIIQTFEYEGAPGEVNLETAGFADVGGRTRLTLRSVFMSVAARDAALETGMEHGIRDSMDRLTELLSRDA
jgi:uncharacterized protein YndB with AHSA1/START domain